jgi:hypothetical protein
MLLEGIRAKIENDGDKYQRFDYFPPHSFEKILPLTVAQDEVKTVENESSIVTGLQVGSTEHVCVDVPVEHVEVEKPLSKKRKLTQDVVGNDSDNVLLPPPVHNRVTRGAIAIKNTNAKNKPLNLISSDENDDDLDDDGVHESLSPDEVASLLDTVQVDIFPKMVAELSKLVVELSKLVVELSKLVAELSKMVSKLFKMVRMMIKMLKMLKLIRVAPKMILTSPKLVN